MGTPKTGKEVKAEIIPGKWADPPAPAIITPILFFSAEAANSYILFGVLCAETILVSYETPIFFRVFSASSIVL